jgi:hypothetical protein
LTTFRDLFTIDDNLRKFLRDVEKCLSVKINEEIVEKIFKDAEDDQVNEKGYIIFQSQGAFFKKGLTISGSVDAYESQTILIEIQNIDKKALNILVHLHQT